MAKEGQTYTLAGTGHRVTPGQAVVYFNLTSVAPGPHAAEVYEIWGDGRLDLIVTRPGREPELQEKVHHHGAALGGRYWRFEAGGSK